MGILALECRLHGSHWISSEGSAHLHREPGQFWLWENCEIAAGDLLVSSSTPGHAMKGTDRSRMLGAVVGKALEPLREGNGVIQVLVTLQ